MGGGGHGHKSVWIFRSRFLSGGTTRGNRGQAFATPVVSNKMKYILLLHGSSLPPPSLIRAELDLSSCWLERDRHKSGHSPTWRSTVPAAHASFASFFVG